MHTNLRPRAIAALAIALAFPVSGRAQNSIAPADSTHASVTAAPMDSATAHRIIFAPLNATSRPDSPTAPPPFLPREGGSRSGSTLKWAALGGVIGGAAGYLLLSGKDANDGDVISAIHDSVQVEAAMVGFVAGAVVGGVIGYIRGGN